MLAKLNDWTGPKWRYMPKMELYFYDENGQKYWFKIETDKEWKIRKDTLIQMLSDRLQLALSDG